MSAKTTKKPRASRGRKGLGGADLAREYRFDYRKAKPNRFARRVRRDAVVVVLDDDVAEVFRDSKRVNALLRATIAAVQKQGSRRVG